MRRGIHVVHAVHRQIVLLHVTRHNLSQIPRQRRRKQQRLTRRHLPLPLPRHAQNVIHILAKSHIQTPIGLIQHQYRNVSDDIAEGHTIHPAVLHVIDQSSRSGHEYERRIRLELFQILAAAGTAVHYLRRHSIPTPAPRTARVVGSRPVRVRCSEDLRLLVNLHRQFSRGTQNQCCDAARLFLAGLAAYGRLTVGAGDASDPQRVLDGG
mmetsp:Transcript_5893/g.12902  ORF Transcript_5893/g.12902 Transcript_5893/m.12902 type:complete len:210 (-) Transcript_5893:430-1059(-)